MNLPTINYTWPYDIKVDASLTSGSTQEVTHTIATDGDFILCGILAHDNLDGESETQPSNFSVRIKNVTTGQEFGNARIPQQAIAPRATGGWKFPQPIRIPKGSTLSFDFADLVAGAGHIASIVLKGYKDKSS